MATLSHGGFSAPVAVPVRSIYLSMHIWLIIPGSVTIKELAVEKDEVRKMTL